MDTVYVFTQCVMLKTHYMFWNMCINILFINEYCCSELLLKNPWNYCLRILPPKGSVPKGTPFENKTLHGNPVMFNLHSGRVSDARHL